MVRSASADRATVLQTQHPEDAIESTAVIHSRDTARLVGEHWFDHAPFALGEFVSHDPETPLPELEPCQILTSEPCTHVRNRFQDGHSRDAGRVRILTQLGHEWSIYLAILA